MSKRRSFHDYMRAYAQDHQHPVNKWCHMIGIPLIVASLPVIPANPPVGVTMFGVGWGFQFVGHVFEKKKPSFTKDWRYLAIGPVWITNEWVEKITGVKMYEPPEEIAPEPSSRAVVN